MKDNFDREITGLRLSVTSRCDMKCIYCHREGQKEGASAAAGSQCHECAPTKTEMTVAEIERILKIAKDMGITRLKITGGEPLLRTDLPEIVAVAKKYMEKISLTTNGALFAKKASALKKAGLQAVNISLDTLDKEKYKQIAGVDALNDALIGVQAAIAFCFSPVKLNVVVMRGYNENEIEKMIKFAAHTETTLQLIELEDIGNHEFYEKHHSDLTPIENWLERRAGKIEERKLHKRKIYYVPNPVEIVRPMHNTHFCANCTRIRITADGKLKPCLMTQEGYVDIVGLIRAGADDSKLKEAFEKAIMARVPYWR